MGTGACAKPRAGPERDPPRGEGRWICLAPAGMGCRSLGISRPRGAPVSRFRVEGKTDQGEYFHSVLALVQTPSHSSSASSAHTPHRARRPPVAVTLQTPATELFQILGDGLRRRRVA